MSLFVYRCFRDAAMELSISIVNGMNTVLDLDIQVANCGLVSA